MEPTDFNGNLTMTDGLPLGFAMGMAMNQIGRASCRERV